MPRCFRWIGATLSGPRALEGLVVLMAGLLRRCELDFFFLRVVELPGDEMVGL